MSRWLRHGASTADLSAPAVPVRSPAPPGRAHDPHSSHLPGPSSGARGWPIGGRLEAVISIGCAVATRYALDISVARTSGAAAFGEYAVVMAYAMTLSVIATCGLPQVANQQIPVLRMQGRWGAVRSFTRLSVLTSIGLGVALGGFAVAITTIVDDVVSPGASLTLIVLVPLASLFAVRRQQLLLSGRTRLGLFAPALASALAASVVLVAAHAFDVHGSVSALGAVTVGYLVLASGHGMSERRAAKEVERDESVEQVRDWLRAGGTVVLSNVATVLTSNLDLLLVAYTASSRETGIYAASSRLALLVTFALAGMLPREGPVFGNLLAAGQPAACWHEFKRACRLSGVLGLVTFAALIAGGGFLLTLFGAGFGAGYSWLCVLAAGRCMSAVTGPAAVLLITMGRRGAAASAAWIGLILGVFIMMFLGARWGPLGIAVGASLGMAFQNWAQFLVARAAIRELRSQAS